MLHWRLYFFSCHFPWVGAIFLWHTILIKPWFGDCSKRGMLLYQFTSVRDAGGFSVFYFGCPSDRHFSSLLYDLNVHMLPHSQKRTSTHHWVPLSHEETRLMGDLTLWLFLCLHSASIWSIGFLNILAILVDIDRQSESAKSSLAIFLISLPIERHQLSLRMLFRIFSSSIFVGRCQSIRCLTVSSPLRLPDCQIYFTALCCIWFTIRHPLKLPHGFY